MKTILLAAAFCFSTICIHAQGFHFGANLSGISSQIEGDKLRGFHHFGYSFGLIGGYTFNEKHFLIISPQFTMIGSNKKDERFPQLATQPPSNDSITHIFVEMDLSTINTLLGYSYRFGDTWTGEKKYRINAGLRIHRIINTDVNIIKMGGIGEVLVEKDKDLNSYFLTVDVGAGINLTRNFGLELSYSHSPQNILKNQKINVTKLAPFYLSFGLSYYFF
jgi:hypothetical protein